MEKPSQETLDRWHSDPKNWKLGMFYFNKEDNRLLPPKKIKQLGWTVNFGNARSLGFFVIIMGAVALITFYLASMEK